MPNIYWNSKQNNKKALVMLEISPYNHGFYNKREFLQIQLQKPKAANGGVLEKYVFLEISQNSQEKTCARASFFIKL